MITLDNIYKRGSKGEIRVWRMEVSGNKHRVVSGILDGKMVESGWTECSGKNLGKSNATTPEEQASTEAEAKYKKKLEQQYHRDVSDIDTNSYVKPMLAVDYKKRSDKLEDGVVRYLQPKLDGIRCISRHESQKTRTGKDIKTCSHIENDLKKVFAQYPSIVLDGELYNHELNDDFNTITSLVRREKPTEEEAKKARDLIQYHVYDVVSDAPFSERLVLMQEIKNLFGPSVKLVDTVKATSKAETDEIYAVWLSEDYEGQMIRLDVPYQEGRRANELMKRKEFITEEFRVSSVEEGDGNWAGCVKTFVLRSDRVEGETFGAGVRGTQEILKNLLISGDTPDWATLRFFTRTPDGVPRFPVVIDWGKDTRND